jgi:hypothetical protein
MKKLIVTFLTGIASLLLIATTWAQSPALGTWEVTLRGRDSGVSYLTLLDNLTLTGHGMTKKSFGLFSYNGTWQLNEKDEVVAAFIQSGNGGTFAGSFVARVTKTGKLRAKGSSTTGKFTLTAVRLQATPNLTGDWITELKHGRTGFYTTMTTVPDGNLAGVFTVSGQGIGPGGAFETEGQLIVNGKRKAAGTLEYSTEDTLSSSFSGSVKKSLERMKFKGQDEKGRNVRVQADRD